jgi:hypothetical protein
MNTWVGGGVGPAGEAGPSFRQLFNPLRAISGVVATLEIPDGGRRKCTFEVVASKVAGSVVRAWHFAVVVRRNGAAVVINQVDMLPIELGDAGATTWAVGASVSGTDVIVEVDAGAELVDWIAWVDTLTLA